jgi:hypothetical protein
LARFSQQKELEWCTYFGGSGEEAVETHGLAVDDQDNAFIASFTSSTDFPTTSGAFQETANAGGEAYVSKFDKNGALVASTYLGGNMADWVEGIAIAPSGDVVLCGGTESTDLPLTSDALRTTGAGREAWFGRLSADLSTLQYLSLFGGSSRDEFRGIAINAEGQVAITGVTESSDFMTKSAFDTTLDADVGDPDQASVYLILEEK